MCIRDSHTDVSIRTAVTAWLSDATAAEATYGHISGWDTSQVTDMSHLFENELDFNEDISGWNVDAVTSMHDMFLHAESFDQDLGWCVDDNVNMGGAFGGTQCALTFCGVSWGGCDIPSNGNVMANGKL